MSNNSGVPKFLRPKQVAGPAADATEREHDEAIVQALAGTRQLRDDCARWREIAERATAETADLRNKYDHLREQTVDVVAKMEYHQRWNLELVTKCNDLEMFVHAEMGRLVDAVNANANATIGVINSGAATIKRFLDDLHAKREQGAYRPVGAPRIPETAADPPTAEEEDRLARLATALSPEQPTQQ